MAKGIFTHKQVNQAIRQGAWPNSAPKFVEYLVVAGGGSGGLESYRSGSGGGGGAGGLLTGIVPVTAGTSYTVTVGAGGASHTGANAGGGSKGNNGNNSIFSSITATGGGGGGGGSSDGTLGVGSGGSGGGGAQDKINGAGSGSGISEQGNAGGRGSGSGVYSSASGGGGAGTVGIGGHGFSSQWGGNGGAGVASNISGTVTTYAGGGGGADGNGILVSSPGFGGVGGGGRGGSYANNGITVVGGSPNTGGGGGGACNQYNYISGAGGSGIVIVRYPGNVQFYTGGAVTYANGHVVHTFYVTGTLAPTTATVLATSEYQISRSLRFNSADSAYLSRTLTTPTNNTVWSFSFWLKRSTLTTQQYFLNVNSYCGIGTSNDIIYFWNNAGIVQASTTAVFRDVSAWYHLVFVSNGTTIKGYVNNSEVMSYTGTITNLNSAVVHNIGRDQTSSSLYLDGYMTEVNFIDGQALTPSSFGETNSNTGVWGPKAYTGTYGTNGFYLNFSDNSNTTAATLGKDYSGNGNNWTPNNFSVTAGVGNDSLLDTPTPYGTDTGLGGEVRGNYCTLNPLSIITGGGPTNGNLSINALTNTGNRISTFLLTSGKWYWEGKGQGYVGAITGLGGEGFTQSLSNGGSKAIGYWYGDGYAYGDTFYSSAGATAYGSSDTIGIALDMDMGNVRFYKNNTLIHNLTFGKAGTSGYVPNLSTGVYPSYNIGGGTFSVDLNFGQRPFTYTAPSGYKAICTTNLPTPAIGASPTSLASDFFNTVLWTGDGAQTRSITGVGFQPDFTWMKIRADTAQDHQLYDAVRGAGAGKNLSTNTTAAEGTVNSYLDSDYGYLSSFDSDGFSVNDGAVATTGGYVNYNARTYVAWNWKASNATAVTDTSGSLTSSVRANRTSGFSIVTYTGNSAADQTVGHGLGVPPNLIFLKSRTTSAEWVTYHSVLGPTKFLYLNQTTGESTVAGYWGTPSSTTFGIKGGGWANNPTAPVVAYCFAEVPGYSAFGSYTGNGSTNGPFIHTGFRPAYVMIKRTDASASWLIQDNARTPFNWTCNMLVANGADVENTGEAESTYGRDYLSNGFKIRASHSTHNTNAATYIYMAFAESPFKYSLAR